MFTDDPFALPRNLTVSIDRIQSFCQRWHITEFALFGSVHPTLLTNNSYNLKSSGEQNSSTPCLTT